MRGFPYKSFPSGWHQVDWSAKLLPEEVRPIRLFGEDLVLYRTEGGVARLVDSACPHLGANLGFGGKVVGECLKCPFHGWEWNLDGTNERIPFVDRPNTRVKLRQWDLRDVDGFLIVWYDALGREPHWEFRAPEFGNSDEFYPPSMHTAGVRKILPHQPIENGPDVLHFPFVHGSGEPAEMVSWDDSDHVLRVRFDLKFGVGKEKTRLTPNGATVAHLESLGYMSMGIVRFALEDMLVSQVVSTTPVDHESSLVFSTTTGRREPGSTGDEPVGRTGAMMRMQHELVEMDFNIWEHQVFVSHPPYAGKEEKYFVRFRRWLEQFFPADLAERNNGEMTHSTAAPRAM
jgi:nitrite reductase/ring-hydroxylating ferredoxin subunit